MSARDLRSKRVAVLGAGPIGLEAALGAAELDADVHVYERESVGANVEAWGHVTLFSPFGMNHTELGRRVLQGRGLDLPDDDALLTGREYRARYLLPLAESALLAGRIETGVTVIGVTRDGLLKSDAIGEPRRGRAPFRILVERDGVEREEIADVVIDATGSYGNPNWMGAGGLPALGERALRNRIEYGIPDVGGAGRGRYAGRRTLLVGGGYSAATTAVGLARLAREAAGSSAAWATQRTGAPPVARVEGDPLPERDRLARAAHAVVTDRGSGVEWWPGTSVTEVRTDGAAFRVRLTSPSGAREERFDRIVANVGYVPDASIYRQLQVHECYATLGPMKLSAAILGASASDGGSDCLKLGGFGPDVLVNPEPNFFILGMKSYGRNSAFLLRTGYEQVHDVLRLLTRGLLTGQPLGG